MHNLLGSKRVKYLSNFTASGLLLSISVLYEKKLLKHTIGSATAISIHAINKCPFSKSTPTTPLLSFEFSSAATLKSKREAYRFGFSGNKEPTSVRVVAKSWR